MQIFQIDDQVSSQSVFFKLIYNFFAYPHKIPDEDMLVVNQIFYPKQIKLPEVLHQCRLPQWEEHKKINFSAEKQVQLFLENTALQRNIDKTILCCLEHELVQKLVTAENLLFQIEKAAQDREKIIFSGSNLAGKIIKAKIISLNKLYKRKFKLIAFAESIFDLLNNLRRKIKFKRNKITLTYFSPKNIDYRKPSILFYNSGGRSEIIDTQLISQYLDKFNTFSYIGNNLDKFFQENYIVEKLKLKMKNLPPNKKDKIPKSEKIVNPEDLFLRHGISKNMASTLFNLKYEFNIAQSLLNKINPQAVVVGNDWITKERIVVELARKKKILTFAVNDGIQEESIHPRSSASYVFSFQNTLEGKYRFAHPAEGQLFLSGSPRFEKMVSNYKKKVKKSLPEEETKKKKTKLIVFATEPGTGRNTKILKFKYEYLLFKNINISSEEEFLIKLHPQDNGEITKQALVLASKNYEIVKGVDIEELLMSCSLWINVCSTTAIEAALLNKPVIILDFDRLGIFEEYVDEKIIFSSKDPEQIRFLINNIFNRNIDNSTLKSKIVLSEHSDRIIAEKIAEEVLRLGAEE